MLEEIDREILLEFIKETQEELGALDAKFIDLEKSPDDSDVINAIFRTIHSIKGSAAFFNLDHIRTFAHEFENLLDNLRKGKKSVTPKIIDILLHGKDCLEAMFERVDDGDMSNDLTQKDKDALAAVEEAMGAEEEEKLKPQDVFLKIDTAISALEEEKLTEKPAVSALVSLIDELREVILGPTDATGGVPIPKMGEILVETGVVSKDDIAGALGEQKKVGEILIEQGKATEDDIKGAVKAQREQEADLAVAKEKKAPSGKTMRIEEEKIDGFMDLVGELIINSEVFNYLEKKLESGHEIDKLVMEFKNANMDFNELTFELQRGLAEVRKVALKGIFQKLPRMVRDLSAQINKQIDFTMSGDDLLVDKSLIEQLESPIVHIIRNSVDHGVELPEDRTKSGKDPVGKVEVTAEEIMGDLVIQIIDDGKGLDAEKLKAKAIEKGLITPAIAETMPNSEANRLIFAPGFSTAQKVTDVSGRGVGMDVVMTMVKEAKGRVDIDTAPGKGMRLTISVPMSSTLITISGLVVAVGEEHYIIPIEWVMESLRPMREQVTTVTRKGEVVEIRDSLYPIMRLHDIFNVPAKYTDPWDGVVMVIEKEGQRCCLLVDEIIDETQAVLKDLGEAFTGVGGVLGGAILGDGNIGLVLDVGGLMRSHAELMEGKV
ncbi:Signal transduction histidine kinase CheA [hydrothermal vent metagenome]|uniref:Chemotaxis protein CheA n=1 Tax=hydrothermal vent metagenome TaxID=652676 RepID=A0A3B1BYH9_9ZZZZ